MLSYCLKCRKNTESKNPKVVMLLSQCAVCDSKKSKPLKEQKARGLVSNIGIRTFLSQIPMIGPLLF